MPLPDELTLNNIASILTTGYRHVLLAIAGIIGTQFGWICIKWIQRRVQNSAKRKRKFEEKQRLIDAVRRNHVPRGTYAEAVKHTLHAHRLSEETINHITSLPTAELVEQLKTGHLLAVDVLHAFQHKAFECDKTLNFITTPIVEAEAAAQACDSAREKKGSLHGLPVSLKDSFGIKGTDCTLGCANWIDHPWSEDSVVVKVLKKQGAIPFLKTNVPQTLVGNDTTSNPIYGATKNPLDPGRTVGGSTGGEASAVAAGASIVGLANDVGSSIRIPSAFCGIYGLKPTSERISDVGNHPLFAGNKQLRAAIGPMGRDVDSLVVIMKALLGPDMFQLDPYTPPIPFRYEIYEDSCPLKIGYYWNDGIWEAVPSVQRAVEEAKAVLEKKGHKLVPWTPLGVPTKAFEYFYRIVLSDQLQEVLSLTYGDKSDDVISDHILMKIPYFIKCTVAFLIKPFDIYLSKLLYASKPFRSMFEWFNYCKEADKWKGEFQRSWQNEGLDAIICPVTACPALPLGLLPKTHGIDSFSWLFNIINYPAGIIPVTKVTADDQEKLKQYKPDAGWQNVVKKGCEGGVGLPVTVQCATLPFQEELCLRIMKELEEGLKEGSRTVS